MIRYTQPEWSLEAMDYKLSMNKAASLIRSMRAWTKDCEEFRNTVTAIKILDDKNKDLYQPGPIGKRGPSSIEVGARNWQFYRVVKQVSEMKKDDITIEHLNKLYSKEVDKEFLGSDGYKLKKLKQHAIEFPKSGWFGYPIVNIERAVVIFPKKFELIGKKMQALEDLGDKELLNKYVTIVERVMTDFEKVIKVETMDFAKNLKK